MTLPHLSGSYFASIETRLSGINSRLADVEGLTPETLAAQIVALQTAVAGKAAVSHTHTLSAITDSTTIGRNIASASNAASVRAFIMNVQPFIGNASITAPNDASTSAPNDAPTNLNTISTLLGILTGEVNATNSRQNAIANIVNANAVKQNTIATILRDVATKLNLNTQAKILNGIVSAS